MTRARMAVRGLGALALTLGALAAAVGGPIRAAGPDESAGASGARHVVERISALQLAQWIRDARAGLRVLDVRDTSAFASRHIPSAESVALMELASIRPRRQETLVVYSDDAVRDSLASAWLSASGHRHVYVVDGGMAAWMAEVIDPIVSGDSAAMVSALSRYFGGVPRAAAARETREIRETRETPSARERRATDGLGFATRRGC